MIVSSASGDRLNAVLQLFQVVFVALARQTAFDTSSTAHPVQHRRWATFLSILNELESTKGNVSCVLIKRSAEID